MRSMFFASLTAAAFLGGVSCERHDWEDTKKLHQPHGGHDEHGEESGHGDAEGHKEEGAGHDKDAGHKEGGHEEGSAGEAAEH